MKTILIVAVCGAAFCYVALSGASLSQPSSTIQPVHKDSIQFSKSIQPLLQQRCSPCHFPDGIMYQKMPFDKPATLLKNEEGILKRFKGEQNELLKRFVEQNKKAE